MFQRIKKAIGVIWFVNLQSKCPYCKDALYDPSVAGNSKLRECGKCGLMWHLL